MFAISFATLVFSGPDAPEGALAAGTGLIMVSAGPSLFPPRVPCAVTRPPSSSVSYCTRTHSPRPPAWPGHSFPSQL